MFRHMVLNSIRGYNLKFKEEYGQQILCADSAEPLRREYFPNYKYQRKQGRVETQESSDKWDDLLILSQLLNMRLQKTFHMVLSVDNADADDIIAILSRERHIIIRKRVMIISGDKDFIQLHKYEEVNQYSPIQKKFVKDDDPKKYLHEQIIKVTVQMAYLIFK